MSSNKLMAQVERCDGIGEKIAGELGRHIDLERESKAQIQKPWGKARVIDQLTN